MTFDERWDEYCARTGHPFAEDAGLAEEFYNAGKKDREDQEEVQA